MKISFEVFEEKEGGEEEKRWTEMAVLLLCGLPAAGKSTLAKKLIEKAREEYDVEHVEFDQVEMMLRKNHGLREVEVEAGKKREEDGDGEKERRMWKMTRKRAYEKVNGLIGMAQSSEESGRKVVVLVDDTLHLKSMRRSYWKLAEKHAVGCGIIFLDIDVETAVRRNKQRYLTKDSSSQGCRMVMETTIRKLGEEMEVPRGTEFNANRERVPILQLRMDEDAFSETQLSEIKQMILFCLGNPLQRISSPQALDAKVVEAARQQTKTDETHQLDLYLRKRIGGLITHLLSTKSYQQSNEAKCDIARFVHMEKKHFLKQLKVTLTKLEIDQFIESTKARFLDDDKANRGDSVPC